MSKCLFSSRMPPFRKVSSCSPSARARTVTAHSLNATGMNKLTKSGFPEEPLDSIDSDVPPDESAPQSYLKDQNPVKKTALCAPFYGLNRTVPNLIGQSVKVARPLPTGRLTARQGCVRGAAPQPPWCRRP